MNDDRARLEDLCLIHLSVGVEREAEPGWYVEFEEPLCSEHAITVRLVQAQLKAMPRGGTDG